MYNLPHRSYSGFSKRNASSQEYSESTDDIESKNSHKNFNVRKAQACLGHSTKICNESFESLEPLEVFKNIARPYIISSKDGETPADLKVCPTPKKCERIKVTEEGLDDWFAQNMNRNLMTMLLAHKDFYIPPSVFESLQKRYKSIDSAARLQAKNGMLTYFNINPDKLGNNKLNSKMLATDPNLLLFDANLLKPLNVEDGTPQQDDISSQYIKQNKSINLGHRLSIIKSMNLVMKPQDFNSANLRDTYPRKSSQNSDSSMMNNKKIYNRDSKMPTATPFSNMILQLREKQQLGRGNIDSQKNSNSILLKKSIELGYVQKAAHILREKLETKKMKKSEKRLKTNNDEIGGYIQHKEDDSSISANGMGTNNNTKRRVDDNDRDNNENEDDELLMKLKEEISLVETTKDEIRQQIKDNERKSRDDPIEVKLTRFKYNIINQMNKITDYTLSEIKTKYSPDRPHSRLKNEYHNLYNNASASLQPNQIKLFNNYTDISSSYQPLSNANTKSNMSNKSKIPNNNNPKIIVSNKSNLKTKKSNANLNGYNPKIIKRKIISPTKGIHNNVNASSSLYISPGVAVNSKNNNLNYSGYQDLNASSAITSHTLNNDSSLIINAKSQKDKVESSNSPVPFRPRSTSPALYNTILYTDYSNTSNNPNPLRKNRLRSKRLIMANSSNIKKNESDMFSDIRPKTTELTAHSFTKNVSNTFLLDDSIKDNLVKNFFNNNTCNTNSDDYSDRFNPNNHMDKTSKLEYQTARKVSALLNDIEIGDNMIDDTNAYDEQTAIYSKKLDIKKLNLHVKGQIDLSIPNLPPELLHEQADPKNQLVQLVKSNSSEIQHPLIVFNDKTEEGILEKPNPNNKTGIQSNNDNEVKNDFASNQLNNIENSNNWQNLIKTTNNNERDNVEFWFLRGMIQMKNKNLYNAIDCFKQVLLLDPKYYLCIFNIGCMYERLNNFDAARKWLKLALELKFCVNETLYALALCEFKTCQFNIAYNTLIGLENISDSLHLNVIYLLALCSKEMKDFNRAGYYYKIINSKIEESSNQKITKAILAYLLLKRRQTTIEMDHLLWHRFKIAYQQCIKSPAKTTFLYDYYIPNDGWKSDYIEEIAQMIKTLNFWKRFPIEFTRKFMPYMKIMIFPSNDVYFLNEDEVCIISRGTIILKDHSGDFLDPKIMAFYNEGDIFGYDEIERYICRRIEIWLYSLTNIELIIIKKSDFIKIWKAQIEFNKFTYITLANNLDIYKNISEQTLYTMFYELYYKEQKFKNEIIYNDNSYITSNVLNEMIELNHNKYKDIQFNKDKKDDTSRSNTQQTSYNYFKNINSIANDNSFIYVKKVGKIEKTLNRGIYLIIKGECIIENLDGSIMGILTTGDFFGEKLLFSTISVTDFGLIRARSDVVELLFLNKNMFYRIPIYEIEIMRKNCLERKIIKNLQHIHQLKNTNKKNLENN